VRLRGSEAAIALAVLLEGVVLSLLSSHFFTTENLLNVSLQASITAIVAVGMTFVILSGGIDLSVGSVVAVAGIATTSALAGGHGYVTAIVGGIAVGLVSGAFAGGIVTRLRVAPFIVTLALMTVWRGLAFVITEGRPVWDLPAGFASLGGARLLGIPVPSVVMGLVFVTAHVALRHTRWGRRLYAVGGNPEAARLAGIATERVVASAYVLCGGLAALGGILLASRMNSGQPNAGLMLELDVIAAVVVGGTSLSGGRGSVLGTFLGTMLIAILRNGLNLLDVNSYVQQVVVGAVILLAVLLDRLRERRT